MSERSPFEPRPVHSRRGGKVKEPLSRERIVDEALRLLACDGLDGMSLRKVALALETGPASLYAYVDDLAALHALVLDRALAAVETKRATGKSWKSTLKFTLTSYARVLMDTPGLATIALGHVALGPNSLRVLDALLDALAKGGIEKRSAAWAADLLLLYATAISAQHAGSADERSGAPELVVRALAAVSPTTYPNVHDAREQLLSGEGGERFAWALDTLLAGVVQRAERSGTSPRQS